MDPLAIRFSTRATRTAPSVEAALAEGQVGRPARPAARRRAPRAAPRAAEAGAARPSRRQRGREGHGGMHGIALRAVARSGGGNSFPPRPRSCLVPRRARPEGATPRPSPSRRRSARGRRSRPCRSSSIRPRSRARREWREARPACRRRPRRPSGGNGRARGIPAPRPRATRSSRPSRSPPATKLSKVTASSAQRAWRANRPGCMARNSSLQRVQARRLEPHDRHAALDPGRERLDHPPRLRLGAIDHAGRQVGPPAAQRPRGSSPRSGHDLEAGRLHDPPRRGQVGGLEPVVEGIGEEDRLAPVRGNVRRLAGEPRLAAEGRHRAARVEARERAHGRARCPARRCAAFTSGAKRDAHGA